MRCIIKAFYKYYPAMLILVASAFKVTDAFGVTSKLPVSFSEVEPSSIMREGTKLFMAERVQPSQSCRSPFNAIGLLRMEWSDGRFFQGSGALISPNTVLTCAHNLVDQLGGKNPGKAERILFFPGSNDDAYDVPAIAATEPFLFNERYVNGEDAWDVGVVKLSQPIHVKFYFQPQSTTNAILVGESLKLAGYPGDKRGEMWQDLDEVVGVNLPTNTLLFTHETFGGSSGSPIYRYDAISDVVQQYAIHNSRTGSDGLKRGLLITEEVNNWIQSQGDLE
jgi:glutamyl endopeptidase